MCPYLVKDRAIWGLQDLGCCFVFKRDDDMEATMRDYPFQTSTEDGMGPVEVENDGCQTSYNFTKLVEDKDFNTGQ